MASDKIIEQKKLLTESLKEKIAKAKSIVFVDYRGLTVIQVDELRTKLKKENIEYKVIKNSTISFAVRDGELKELEPFLNGPTAIAISYDDEIITSKLISEFSKSNEKLEIKAGVVDGKIITIDEIKVLASIPSKEVLIARMLGGLNAPISGLANVLNANIKGLVVVLNAIAEKK